MPRGPAGEPALPRDRRGLPCCGAPEQDPQEQVPETQRHTASAQGRAEAKRFPHHAAGATYLPLPDRRLAASLGLVPTQHAWTAWAPLQLPEEGLQ